MVRIAFLWALAILVSVGGAHAEVKSGDTVLFVNAGYVSGRSSISGDNIDGAGVSLEALSLVGEKSLSAGFVVGYGQIQQSVAEDSTRRDYTISTLPILLGGKLWIGRGAIQGYVGLAFGAYFGHLESTLSSTAEVGAGDLTSKSTVGFGVGVPLGAALSLGESIVLSANYTFNWFADNEFLEDDLLNTVSVGVGFKFGSY
jgi:hypothetical protein